jgi:hypothetical protein
MKMRSRCTSKWAARLLSVAGATVLAMGSLSASAFAAPNPGPAADGPQSANVPYVAWIGEHVRLVACDPVIDSSAQYANYSVEDWSGYQFQPPTPDGDAGNNIGQIFDPGPSAFFTSSEPAHSTDGGQEGCVATDYKSLNPGLSRIRLDIRDQATGEVVFSHQFLVIWLTANKPTLSEAGTTSTGSETFQSQLSGEGQSNLSSYLGDPSGDGSFVPSPFDPGTATNQDKGLIQIRVSGSFPVVEGTPLSHILESPAYTLPEAWPTLAGILASSSEETEPPGTNPGLWDIHGSPSRGATTNASSTTGALNASFFRSAFGDYTSGETATVGPYDPQAAEETLLSDGEVTADDAPMPALRVDVRIAKNKGDGELGGVGQISGASKALIYSHNFNGDAEEEGNLYNPYYGEYIPSTDRPVNEASGIDGPSPGGDFPGFLNNHPEPYTFWQSVHSSEPRESHATGCLRRAPGKSTDATSEDDYFTPGGNAEETFYTDERGEAYVTYTPGDEFYFENLGLKSDTNEGCDLESLYGKEIGSSSITAEAIYPYEPVDYQPVTSESLVKTVKSLWLKETYEFLKGESSADQNVRILVAKAQDIDGYPFVGEEVCFDATANSAITAFDGHLTDTAGLLGREGAVVSLGGSTVNDPADEGSNHLCETTNSEGLAAIEVTNSSESEVDVTTHFENEGITRDQMFSFAGNAASKKAKEAEEKAAVEKRAAEEEKTAQAKREAEEAAKTKASEEAAKAEKEKFAKEIAEAKTTEEKETLEKQFKEEEEAAAKVRAEEAALEKQTHKEEAEAEKKQHEEEVKAAAVAAAAPQQPALASQLPSAFAAPSGVASGGVDAYTASASSKGHKAHKAKHKSKKNKKHKKHKKK